VPVYTTTHAVDPITITLTSVLRTTLSPLWPDLSTFRIWHVQMRSSPKIPTTEHISKLCVPRCLGYWLLIKPTRSLLDCATTWATWQMNVPEDDFLVSYCLLFRAMLRIADLPTLPQLLPDFTLCGYISKPELTTNVP
jgi:hypothetical protein